MFVRIPVGCRLLHRFNNLLPRFETPPFEGQRLERFPPRLDQIQVGGVGGLKHEFPAWIRQIEKQDIDRSMHREII